nr:hypothetical protein JVH1_0750 [Rhodococcus sp. JVH1]
MQSGETTQSVVDVPDGSYVALASCSRTHTDPAIWVSNYPGLEEYLAHTRAPRSPGSRHLLSSPSPARTPHPPPTTPPDLSDLGTIFGSSRRPSHRTHTAPTETRVGAQHTAHQTLHRNFTPVGARRS